MPLLGKFLKKNLITLILILFVYSWFLVSNNVFNPQSVNIQGTKAGVTVFKEPQDGKAPIINEINNAKKEILIEVYLMSDKDIIQSLIDANKRNVDVRIILEKHPFGGGNINIKTKAALEENGIKVMWSNPKFALTHEKAVIIDGSKLFVLNQNLTTASFIKNREFDVLDINPSDVNQARNIFVSDWDNKDITMQTASELVISPNNSRSKIINLLNSALKQIEIEDEVIEDKQVATILKNKSKNIKIKIIIPTFTQIKANKLIINDLVKSGILVKTVSSPYIHAKLIIVDDKISYVGSINLSSQSMDENRELGIILSEQKSLFLLNNSFDLDWNNGKSVN